MADHLRGADLGRIVAVLQLLSNTLVEYESRGFGGGASHAADDRGEAYRACYDNNMPVVPFDHVRQKLPNEVVVRQGIDCIGLLEHVLPLNKYCLPSSNPGVVYQNRWVAESPANLDGRFMDGLGREVMSTLKKCALVGKLARGFWISNEATLMSLALNFCTINSTVPLEPPVTATISRLQSHVLSVIQLLYARRLRYLCRQYRAPTPGSRQSLALKAGRVDLFLVNSDSRCRV